MLAPGRVASATPIQLPPLMTSAKACFRRASASAAAATRLCACSAAKEEVARGTSGHRRRKEKRHLRLCVSILWTSISLSCALGGFAETIHVTGLIERRQFNPETGAEYKESYRLIHFSVLFGDPYWQVQGTNLHMPDHWLSVCHDGTNTYAFYPPVLEDDKLSGASLPSRAMIYTGSWWLLHYILNERMQIYPAWIAYCLRPDSLRPDKQGRIVTLPIHGGRDGLPVNRSEVVPAKDRRFIDVLRVIRDRSLDRPPKEWMLLPHYNTPRTLQEYNWFLEDIEFVHGLPDGLVRSEFVCMERLQYRGWSLPVRCVMDHYLSSVPGKLWRRVTVLATNVQWSAEGFDPVPRPSEPVEVADYRYRRFERKRLFLHATYTLQPGQPWPTDRDPELLAQAEHYIRHGPRYDAFLRPGPRHYLAWTLFLALVVLPTLLWTLKLRKTGLPRSAGHRSQSS